MIRNDAMETLLDHGAARRWDDLQQAVSAEGCPEFDSWVAKAEWLALAWAGEVGEVCNEIKKIRRDDAGQLTPKRRVQVRAELVDSMVYALVLLDHLDMRMSTFHELIAEAHQRFLARSVQP